MKYIKLFENFRNNYVGIHCSPYTLYEDNFYGEIIDEYYLHFQQILELIQFDYNEVKKYLEQIKTLISYDKFEMEDEESAELIYEIVHFFRDNNINGFLYQKQKR